MARDFGRGSQLARGIQIEWLSVVWMVIEGTAAVLAGVLAHSVALVAFGADSVIELVAGGALLYRLYVEANEGGSERVERAEHTASWIVGIALLALAAYIVISSVVSLFAHSRPNANALGIGIAVASSILMPFLAATKKSIGRRIGSKALISDGSCSMVCAYMSWILLAGVCATAFAGWWWADSVAALGFVWFVTREGLETVNEARSTDAHKEATLHS
ncbi:MAG: cation transporter [Spirochaetia bacterium]